ncbi:transcription initiation factor IIA subunit 2 isoform X1 [Athene cunicularia]|nr:transcription initiation factor IIA subunit 2 isoform X1 [Athene cunicularia]
MAYQLYRNTTLGNSLQESLDELIQSQQITPQLALQVLLQFDKAINSALAQRVRNRVNFRGSLNTYRFCDNVWTFVLNDVEFREVTELVKVDKVKIVACDGKSKHWFQYCRMNRTVVCLQYFSVNMQHFLKRSMERDCVHT